MVMKGNIQDQNEAVEGGRYAPTEEELYNKALELLDKCRVEIRREDSAPAA